jgi:hypothetical protein
MEGSWQIQQLSLRQFTIGMRNVHVYPKVGLHVLKKKESSLLVSSFQIKLKMIFDVGELFQLHLLLSMYAARRIIR